MQEVTISLEEYQKLIDAKLRLDFIRKAAGKDKSSYGYSVDTSKLIDAALEIERNN